MLNKFELIQRITIGVFLVTLLSGGVLFIFTPKEEISIDEKRELAHMPQFSLEAIFKGTYFKNIDSFVADNFIYRKQLSEIAAFLKMLRGSPIDDIEVIVQEKIPNIPVEKSPLETPQFKIELVSDKSTPEKVENEPYENIESIIIFKGRAIQMIGVSEKNLRPLSKVINEYKEQFGNQLKIYFMAFPIGTDFYLPKKISRGAQKERYLIDQMHAQLSEDIIKVDIYNALAPHQDDYIYFKTDHHWTGLGAYYAFDAFTKAAQLEALPLSSLTKKTIPNYLGSLYQRTESPTLRASGDVVDYYKIPNATKTIIFQNTKDAGNKASLYAEYARGSLGYGVFLGGDFPLMKITSDVNNGQKILIIKDSYGNAFAPYLASRYEETYVIDYRYFKGNIKQLIQDHGIQNLIFAHNTFVIQNPYTAKQERQFLNQN
jgi:hypothetical protein